MAPHPGSGGVLAADPEDFVVDEILAYTPAGTGAHAYVRVRKQGLTTPAAARQIGAAAGIPAHRVSWAGLKDRHAIATQWLCFPWPVVAPLPSLRAAESEALVVLEITRHPRKLKLGHARGNQFAIRIRQVPPGGIDRAGRVLERLRKIGWPNAFGPQRFGRAGDNAEHAQAILRKERAPPAQRSMNKLLMSALQAHMFNRQLTLRLERDLGLTALQGDIMYKHDERGGMFAVSDPAPEQGRMDRLEISPTGLLPGARPWRASGIAGELERQSEKEVGLPPEAERYLGRGVRRTMRWPLDPAAELRAEDGGNYQFSVRLPSGAYATVLLDLLVQPPHGPLTRTESPGGGRQAEP